GTAPPPRWTCPTPPAPRAPRDTAPAASRLPNCAREGVVGGGVEEHEADRLDLRLRVAHAGDGDRRGKLQRIPVDTGGDRRERDCRRSDLVGHAKRLGVATAEERGPVFGVGKDG